MIHKPNGLSKFQINSEHEWQETKEAIIFEAVEDLTAKISFEQPLQILRAYTQVIQDIKSSHTATRNLRVLYWCCRIDPQALDTTFAKYDMLLPITLRLAIKGYQSEE
ncbi:hypothetical protein UA3_00216 [Enterococcus faecium EnGen0263]|nr:hypothetical protein UA3_00216 [Enterococcus faecium EnGen0263]